MFMFHAVSRVTGPLTGLSEKVPLANNNNLLKVITWSRWKGTKTGLLCLLVWTAEEASEVAEIGNEQKELQGDTQTPRFRDSWPGNFSRDTPSQC